MGSSQVLALTLKPIGLPENSVTYLILILLIGFPINIYYIWKFSLLKYEIQLTEDPTTTYNKSAFQKMYFSTLVIVTVITTLSVIVIINNNFFKSINLPDIKKSDKIAVLKFTNNTGDEKLNIIGNMTEDWIGHGITENNAGQIITQDIVKSYADVIKTQKLDVSSNEILNKYLKPGKKITGSYFLDGNKLIFKSSIENGLTGETLISLESIECDSKNPIDCIKTLGGKIVTYLLTNKIGGLNLENQPPNYEAYKALLEVRISKRENDLDKYVVLLDKP